MRRATRLGLAAIVLLLVLFGAYAAYWWIVAGRIENGIAAWAQSIGAKKVDVSWRRLRVTGFPLAFRIEIDAALLRDRGVSPAPELRIPALDGTARFWDFADWRLAAVRGLSADLAGAGRRPPLRLAAQAATGAVTLGAAGGAKLWLTLGHADAEAGGRVEVKSADAWIVLPATAPRTHTDPSLGLALALRQVHLPAAPPVLGDTIEEAAFGITVKGALPDGPLARAVAAWRDQGGTIEFDNLHLDWGGVGASANGTLALDRTLQPIGAFSGAVEGYGEVLKALVHTGRLRAGDAVLAQLALTMLAKSGPDGQPQIATSFTIQDGQMYLGPAKLGEAPRIVWE